MKRFEITCAAVLINLFLGNAVVAGDETRTGRVSAPASISSRNSDALSAKNIAVRVRNDGEQITVEATFVVPILPEQAWAVLTDFDNIPNFNSGVISSRVTGRTGNRVWVSQKGATKYGFLTFSYDSKREIDLFPFSKIQERLTSGSMRKLEETTQLTLEGDQTRITYHAVFIPGTWIPPMVGNAFIKHEAREQFAELVNEMIRRNQVKIASREP
ncbi:polyketide cyclase/dehydrase/lipid transport protein [Nitrosospira sp. Nsp2]|uniref:SRPBCC family protein n=1 Tax=Nitrosospira sp. Nsp2 TaxID=136548 RepID=UPI000D30C89A|nr:SRPBCC family protein [Nitrosospira sp. Nsp2]PTR17434.1 polyketide cyclase/dehydrase/lipid transport protein [Nitrosospira sp. Nsp2]